ncbi:MAG: hypothetical protein JRF33_26515, partial [Deltaproteobacteria bacterium]|nr:hypothetical protein [Deltaproteobacteria bacterium]
GPQRLDPGSFPYLIVAPAAYENLGGEYSLEVLRDQRTSQGLDAVIVNLEWIQANYTGFRPDGEQDDATRLREFLTDAYTEWGTEYVLLVGDADGGDMGGESGDMIMPSRKLYVDVGYPDVSPDEIPSDLYFSCLDGDFDHNANGRYGEHIDGAEGGLVDLMAELFVGRAPADSHSEVEHFVAKTLAYESGAGAWLQQVWMVGELLWQDPSDVWGGDAMDEIIEGSEDAGFSTLGFDSFPFFISNTLYDRDMPAGEGWTTADMVGILNAGPHIVNHLGHSNVTYNMRLMNAEVDGLINAHPFLHYSQGCYNGSFDNRMAPEEGGAIYSRDCIAEHMVMGPRGAFASVANSRYGWGSIMTDGPSQRFQRQFWDAFFGEGLATLGAAHADSKEDNIAGFSDPFIRWVGYENNLLGDPAVVLKKSINTTDPLLGAYPPQLGFVSRLGDEAPAPQMMALHNDGVDALSFTVSCDQAWVQLGSIAGDAPVDIQIQVDPTGLAPGLHLATLTFESPEAGNSPLTVPVEFLLVEVPEESVPHLIDRPRLDGQIDEGEYAQALTLPMEQGGDVLLYLSVVGSKLYLAVDDGLDPSVSEFDRLQIFFDRNLDGQWPTSPGEDGMYFLMARDGGRAVYFPVFNDGAGTLIDFYSMERNPEGFEGVIGQQDNHRIYEAALDVETSHVDVGPLGRFGVYISVENAEQFGGGTITGAWPPVVPELDDQFYMGRLDLSTEDVWLHASPGYLVFQAVRDGLAPAAQQIEVLELHDAVVTFSADTGDLWVSVEEAGGVTPASLTISVDPTGLATGVHEGFVQLQSDDVDNPTLDLPVRLEILPRAPRMSVSPALLEISVAEDEEDPVLTLTMENSGDENMDVVLSIPDDWLSLERTEITVPANSARPAFATVALGQLSLGLHQTSIFVESAGVEGSPVEVAVEVDVLRHNSAPPIPTPLSPAAGDVLPVGVDLEMRAEAVEDPEGDPVSYVFQLFDSDNEVIAEGPGLVDADQVTWRPALALEAGSYRWRVASVDDRPAYSRYSAALSFSLEVEDEGSGCGCGQARPDGTWMLAFMIGLYWFRRRFV